MNHLVGHSRGVRIKGGITTIEYKAYGLAKAKRQNRREPRERPEKAGTRLAIDFYNLEENAEGFSNIILVINRYSGYI